MASMKMPAKKCFVIIPFADEFEEVFRHAILSAVEQKGYQCERLKEVSGPINIINEIVSNLFEADLVVADLSRLNPNVFYELGIAHAGPPSAPTIMIAERDEKIPFDISVFQVLKYDRGYEGIVNLREGLARQIEFAETQPHLTTNPVQDYLLKRKYFGAQRAATAKAFPDQKALLEELQAGQLRLQILSTLAEDSASKTGMSITELHQKLAVLKRKMLVALLNEYLQAGVLEKKKGEKTVRWLLSEAGQKLEKKIGRRHS